jgi:DNA-binding NtrC family response regulator
MHSIGTAERHNGVAFPAVEDNDMAGRSPERLLIRAPTRRGVETLARRIHGAEQRSQFPFVHTWAGDLPIEPEALRAHCSTLLDAAAGGSVLISEVEDMPPVVQDALIELLARLEAARSPSAAVRLIAGTTVSLLDQVAAGTFSERLFYRLNIIHLMAEDGSPRPCLSKNPVNVHLNDVLSRARPV